MECRAPMKYHRAISGSIAVLNLVEESAVLPESFWQGYIALIPEEADEVEPKPGEP